jgi:AcrR family transcriptional regulator
MAPTTTPAKSRQSADDRRASILEAALGEFALGGLHGTSTEAIARRAGISQPYLFRLYGTKKDLFLAVVRACFARTLTTFQRAAADAPAGARLEALGTAYVETLERHMLMGQLQTYAACEDPDVRAVVRAGYKDLVDFVRETTGASNAEIGHFFATGMLINVLTAMDLEGAHETWGHDLLEGCRER